MSVPSLPLDAYMPAIVAAVRERRALVLSAPPGAGKTTRVPPALAGDGRVIVLQPRRVAARAIAQRIARERDWTLGEEVGWQVRLEKRFTARTRVLLATEGILTARLQSDPLLSDFTTIVLDEFHERSIHADLGLALARQAWLARSDLRLIVMSATLDTRAVAAFLDDAPVIAVPASLHPIEIDYRPAQALGEAAREMLAATGGSILCFLPGAGEIRRAEMDVRAAVGAAAEVVTLHGSLPADEQDRALDESAARRVILATNIAETSLTVPRVTCVIDTGLHKVARYDPDRAVDSLETERISAASATQRAGRAGRLGPGRVRRLWDAADRLRAHDEPEIHRVDLSEPVLEILSWGGDPASFAWFDRPSDERIGAALDLLRRLGAVRDGRVTSIGREMQKIPVHPRLARMLIEARGAHPVAVAAALLSERHAAAQHPPSTTSDLLSAVQDERALPRHVMDVARRLAPGGRRDVAEEAFLRAVFAGYPDRVARRRAAGSPRFLLASGHGAVLSRESGVHDAEFIVAIDVQAGRRGEGAEARIRMASAIDASWLQPTDVRLEHALDEHAGAVRAVERTYYDALVVGEAPCAADPDEAARLLADAFAARDLSPADAQIVRRLRFAGRPADVPALARAAARGCRALSEVRIDAALDPRERRELERLAPETIGVPSGRAARLEYQEDGSVTAGVKLQELFGLSESPRIGPRQEPVVFLLLAPNGRPVQTTRDLRSFWNTTYPEVRRELRGRYPKHPWPEDPWTAQAKKGF